MGGSGMRWQRDVWMPGISLEESCGQGRASSLRRGTVHFRDLNTHNPKQATLGNRSNHETQPLRCGFLLVVSSLARGWM